MPPPSPRFWEVFFDVYEALPRQGPGSRNCAARALALCEPLPHAPAILDLGCGSGAQTLHLAELTNGTITAIDSHAPFVATLQRHLTERRLAGRITPLVGDMAAPPAAPGSVDLLWCEGAAYFLGIERALTLWRPLLRPGGHLAFTEAVWLRPDPPPEVREMWAKEYPAMTDVAGNLALAARCGYEARGHFTLPDSAWWDDFYHPMERRIAALGPKYSGDVEALDTLASISSEIELHRRFGDTYGYEFIVLRRGN